MEMLRLDAATPFGTGVITDYSCVKNTDLMNVMIRYRRMVAGGYQAVTRDEISERFPGGRFVVSPKIDGEIWFLVLDRNDACLVSPRGRVIHGAVPLLEEARSFATRCAGTTILAGELFAASKTSRPRVGDVATLFGGGAAAKVDSLGFAPFDLVVGGDGQGTMPLNSYDDRLAVLQRLCDGGKRVTPVKTEVVGTAHDIVTLFTNWVTDGKAEGLVVRVSNERIFKVKESITIDAVIIGYTIRSEDAKQTRSLLFALMREDGLFHVLGSTGNLGDENQRVELMELLVGSENISNYRHVSSSGELYQFVRPIHVAEIKVTDLQSQDSSGQPPKRMVLKLEGDRWESVRQLPGVSLIHPVFVRLRPDKQVNAADIRISQVTDRCYIPDVQGTVTVSELPKSELIRREVYVKKAKDQVAVRKLLVWKTNKENIDPAYPAYVVHFTDYSAGRKEPLAREVRLAPSQEAAGQIAEAMLEENIKKGWEPVSRSGVSATPVAPAQSTVDKVAATESKVAGEPVDAAPGTEVEVTTKPKSAARGKKKTAESNTETNEPVSNPEGEVTSTKEVKEKPVKNGSRKKKDAE
jgi:hypothetical protein